MDGNGGHRLGGALATRARVALIGPPRAEGTSPPPIVDEPEAPHTPVPGRIRPALVTAAAVCVIAASLSLVGWIHSQVGDAVPPGGTYAVVETPPDAGGLLPPNVRTSPQPLVPLLPPDRAPAASPRASRSGAAKPSGPAATPRPVPRRVTGLAGVITGYAGRCLHVTGDVAVDGIPVEMTACDGRAGERWTMASDGTVRALGKCLNAVGDQVADGTGVQLAGCHGTAGQQWRFTAGRDLVNPHADKCLDVKDFDLGDRALVQLWTCVGGPNQKWAVPA
jgi:ricin-type beta-trefoil lectin protein